MYVQPVPVVYTAAIHSLKKEQRQLADMTDDMRFLHYLAIDGVATWIFIGAIAMSSPLDARDFQNLHAARDPSPHYYAGYFQQKAMKPLTTPLTPTPGQTLCFSISRLVVKSIDGYTHEIRVVSEHEGYFLVISAKLASGKDLFGSLHAYIATAHNARIHRVVLAHANAESVMKSMTAVFGTIGVILTLSPPGQHALRIERYTEKLNKRARAMLDFLPYILPSDLMLYLDMDVAATTTLVLNSASFLWTMYKKVHGARRKFHATIPFLPFGAVCSVAIDAAKIQNVACNDCHSYP
jgi:hypothetical protein